MVSASVFLALVIGQPAPFPPTVKPPVPFPSVVKKADSKKPYIVFVGLESRAVGEYKVTRDDKAFPKVGVYIVFPGEDFAYRMFRNDGDVLKEVREREASRTATPFDPTNPNTARHEGQDEGGKRSLAKGAWSPHVVWSEEYERYAPAKNTQSLSRVGSFSYRDSNIAIVPRIYLKAKWQVPGGMESIEGWKSDLYRYVPTSGAKQRIAMVAVFNGSNNQDEQGHVRDYPDGTEFHDVLSHQGRVFEHRIAIKDEGRWSRFVAYSNRDARPAGYFGLRQSCASCHNEAGTGGYGTGLVPGGDTVISDPLHGIN